MPGPGIAPEKLLRALLLQAFYSIRSERQLMEQIGYNLLFRWFVGPAMDAPVWGATTFSKNRDRLLDGDVAQRLLAAVIARRRQGLRRAELRAGLVAAPGDAAHRHRPPGQQDGQAAGPHLTTSQAARPTSHRHKISNTTSPLARECSTTIQIRRSSAAC